MDELLIFLKSLPHFFLGLIAVMVALSAVVIVVSSTFIILLKVTLLSISFVIEKVFG